MIQEFFTALRYENGRPVISPGTADVARITDQWLQYLVDTVHDHATQQAKGQEE
jgi:hypothetical protein